MSKTTPPKSTKEGTRICIYAKDIMLLTGKSLHTARRMLYQIRKMFNKPPYAVVTVLELAWYLRVDESYLQEHLAELR